MREIRAFRYFWPTRSFCGLITAFLLVSGLMLAMGSPARAAGVAAEVIEIGCKTVIQTAGHYRLVEDCVLGAQDEAGISIEINAGGVVVEVDLDGHIISGPGI